VPADQLDAPASLPVPAVVAPEVSTEDVILRQDNVCRMAVEAPSGALVGEEGAEPRSQPHPSNVLPQTAPSMPDNVRQPQAQEVHHASSHPAGQQPLQQHDLTNHYVEETDRYEEHRRHPPNIPLNHSIPMDPHEPLIHPREPLIHPREPLIHPREPRMHPREPRMHPHEHRMHSHEPPLNSREQSVHSSEPSAPLREPPQAAHPRNTSAHPHDAPFYSRAGTNTTTLDQHDSIRHHEERDALRHDWNGPPRNHPHPTSSFADHQGPARIRNLEDTRYGRAPPVAYNHSGYSGRYGSPDDYDDRYGDHRYQTDDYYQDVRGHNRRYYGDRWEDRR